jgi:dihydrodipicolinate synthase/N-acetylneuraminate lyase
MQAGYQKIKGIVPPMITPLKSQDELDIGGLERLIEHILSGGVHGLFLLGTTGEGPSLSYRLRREVLKRTCALVNGRVPILACITDTSFTESIALAAYAADCGCHAVAASAPYYFAPDQPELMEYVEHLAAHMPLPLYLYNMPGMTKVNFSADLIRRSMDIPGIVGLKDSSCSMLYFHEIRAIIGERDDYNLLVGPEEMLGETVLLGGDGGVNGGANLYPSLYVDLYNAAANRDVEKVWELHRKVIDLSRTVYHIGRHPSSVIKGLKCSLHILGLCDDFMAEPYHRFREPERQKIRQVLIKLGLL